MLLLLADPMNWPEAFRSVGIAFAIAFAVWALVRYL